MKISVMMSIQNKIQQKNPIKQFQLLRMIGGV